MLNKIKNNFLFSNKYKTHPEAVIISCFFNPQNSPYRIKAFNHFYNDIKHLNHRIIECVIGDSKAQLPITDSISHVYTESLLWHKETLLNKIISELPKKFKYVFWVDADIIFTNKNWVIEGVKKLKTSCNIIQPFEYCIHMHKDEVEPNISYHSLKNISNFSTRYPFMWRSFSANYETTNLSNHHVYDLHGHVGFAWAAKREILEKVPLYDKALVGGADHIIAHAAAGHILHNCIIKSFTDNLFEIQEWSHKFFSIVKGKVGYVKGDIFHIWHGDLEKRQYLKRIQDFTEKSKSIVDKDENGLYVTKNGDDEYIKNYFKEREVTS